MNISFPGLNGVIPDHFNTAGYNFRVAEESIDGMD